MFFGGGVPRFFWDEEIGAHDVEVPGECLADGEGKVPRGVGLDVKGPERVRLRTLLDDVCGAERDGGKLDLQPVRRLVALLVQSSERHTWHGMLPPRPKDPCARGDRKCPHCRYGYPKDKLPRGGKRKMRLVKDEAREGAWKAEFPRNDPLCCSYEPHVLLGNVGNVDWRPILNLWAVTEYITKYAMKAQTGSRRIGDLLKKCHRRSV